MSADLDQRIWIYLPARRDRRRTTVPVVIAAELGVPVEAVTEALLRMERGYHVVRDRRGSWHRGTALPAEAPTESVAQAPEPEATLWD
jgi:hypothetical protein